MAFELRSEFGHEIYIRAPVLLVVDYSFNVVGPYLGFTQVTELIISLIKPGSCHVVAFERFRVAVRHSVQDLAIFLIPIFLNFTTDFGDLALQMMDVLCIFARSLVGSYPVCGTGSNR
jgi:hypothetical protein